MTYQVICGNNIEVLKTLPDNSVHSIVTDPPYGISFLGKDWDSKRATQTTSKLVAMQNLPSGMKHTSLADDLEFQFWMRDVFAECYRVLKPGGYLLAFSAARTYHHTAMAAQLAGYEIRDQIMWIYGSGFPKSQDIGRQIQRKLGVKESVKTKITDGYSKSEDGKRELMKFAESEGIYEKNISIPMATDPLAKQWSGWGTNLKPAHEPIVMARKPISEKNIADNCIKHGTGALNIDATRVGDEVVTTMYKVNTEGKSFGYDGEVEWNDRGNFEHVGRFPANVIHDGSDEVVNMFPDKCGNAAKATRTKDSITGTGASLTRAKQAGTDNGFYDGLGSAARFFYCPKVSRKERHIGHEPPNAYDRREEGLEVAAGIQGLQKLNGEKNTPGGNNHPTVKPVELMKYLIKLVTPPGGTVLDPFNGSGSTGMAAVELGHNYIGIDLDPNYVEISLKRIAAWADMHKPTPYQQLFKE